MSIYAAPSTEFEATAAGYASNLTGTLGVRITDGAEETVVARTTSDISEYPESSGIYTVVLTAPSELGQYQIVWDADNDYAVEDLVITSSGYAPDPAIPGPAIDQVLTSDELLSLRNSLSSWYPDSATIYRKSAESQDDYGGYGTTAPRVLLSQNIPCEIDSSPKNDQERILAGSLVSDTQMYFVTIPANREVIVDDQIILTSRNGLALRVLAVLAPESWELERRLITTKSGA